MSTRSAFTLIELLVVIAIIAILAVVVVLTLNPAQLLAQSRDANRVSDMATLASAISLYQSDQSGSAAYRLGTSTYVYPSLPNATSTSCAGLGLPLLPAIYQYYCANQANLRIASSTGWLPINFQAISAGAPFGSLPIDPVNNSSSRLYYSYATNGTQYDLTAVMESAKYRLGGTADVTSGDGGTYAYTFEKGTMFGLEPLDYGDPSLIGYWPLNEGVTNTPVYDYSGSNATGTWTGTAVGSVGYYSPGLVQTWAGAFDGSTTIVNVPPVNVFNEHAFTVTAWVYPTASKTDESILGACQATTLDECLHLAIRGGIPYYGFWSDDISGGSAPLNQWSFLAFTYAGGAGGARYLYLNGALVASGASPAGLQVSSYPAITLGKDNAGPPLQGLLNDVRLYNRMLSQAEVQALYNSRR